MKKLCLMLAALLLMTLLAVPAMASPAEAPLHIAGDTYYDPAEKAFLYYVNASQVIRSSVADGMITEQAVPVLPAQAKKMENISAIEMMSVYGEAYTEVTLEELEKYINKNCR